MSGFRVCSLFLAVGSLLFVCMAHAEQHGGGIGTQPDVTVGPGSAVGVKKKPETAQPRSGGLGAQPDVTVGPGSAVGVKKKPETAQPRSGGINRRPGFIGPDGAVGVKKKPETAQPRSGGIKRQPGVFGPGSAGGIPKMPETAQPPKLVKEEILVPPELTAAEDSHTGCCATPGSTITLWGKGFGGSAGTIRMYGNFPGSPLELQNVVWKSPEKASGVIPASVLGNICVSNVYFEVQTANYLKSNKHELPWAEDEAVLDYKNDSAVKAWCDDDANYNTCNNVTIKGDYCAKLGETFADPDTDYYDHSGIGILGAHSNCGTLGDDKGTDNFEIKLKNGWYMREVKMLPVKKSSSDEGVEGPSPGWPGHGTNHWKPSFEWHVTPKNQLHYAMEIKIQGPVGCSYN